MCGSPCASAPPTRATLRTRTFDKVRSARLSTGRRAATLASCSTSLNVAIAPMRKALPATVMRECSGSMPCRQISRVGWNTPAFIISISAVPPATARTAGSCGSSSDIASRSDVGSTISNGITEALLPADYSLLSVRSHVQHMLGDLGAGTDPDIRRRHRLADDLFIVMRAAMMTEDMGVAGDVDDAKLVLAGARDVDHFVERVQHHPRRMTVLHRRHVVDVVRQRNGDDPLV